jgi:hypothetical protein
MNIELVAAFIVATLGWILAGFSAVAINRVDYINPLMLRSDVRACGFLLALAGTIYAALVSHWWWGLVAFFVTPNVAAMLIMMLTPRS